MRLGIAGSSCHPGLETQRQRQRVTGAAGATAEMWPFLETLPKGGRGGGEDGEGGRWKGGEGKWGRERDGERKKYPGFSLRLPFGLSPVSPLAESSGKPGGKGNWDMPFAGSACRVEG